MEFFAVINRLGISKLMQKVIFGRHSEIRLASMLVSKMISYSSLGRYMLVYSFSEQIGARLLLKLPLIIIFLYSQRIFQ